MLAVAHLWIVLLCTSLILCELCLKKDDKSLSCEEIDVSSLVAAVAKVTVSVEIKDCHVPVDFIFTVQDSHREWVWTHTFVNEDEIQEVKGSQTYLLLRVKVKDTGNSSIRVQGNFVVVGEEKPQFLDHTFTVDNSTLCPVVEKQTGSRVVTLLPLIVFILLCCLIVLTGIAFLIWFHVRRRRKSTQSQTLSGSRPVSSVYSYEEEDYIDKARAAAIAANKTKKARQTGKSSTAVIRNSIYRESLLMDDADDMTNVSMPYVSYTTEDDVKYSSLPRHFGGRAYNWSATAEDYADAGQNFTSRTLPRRVSESPDILSSHPPRQIPAKDYLGIDSGSSRPHYSATLFQSFRGGGGGFRGGRGYSNEKGSQVKKQPRGPLSAQTHLLDKNYTSSASNTPSPQGSYSQVATSDRVGNNSNYCSSGSNTNNSSSSSNGKARVQGHSRPMSEVLGHSRARSGKPQEVGKRLSAIRLLHDCHDDMMDDFTEEPTDRDPLRSGRY